MISGDSAGFSVAAGLQSEDDDPVSINVWRPVETVLTSAARLAWPAFQAVNRRLESSTFQPKWAPAPLMKSHERSKPPLGWPRSTDSLCPTCVKEARRADPVRRAVDRDAGQRARRRDQGADRRARRPRHRREDVPDPRHLHRHAGHRRQLPRPASSSCSRAATSRRSPRRSTTTAPRPSSTGAASVLTIDLTNRCNMMCDPCFMDANQVGYVHELTFDDVKKLLDDAISIKPRRQMTVQFSGGEPTISPHFLEAVAYAREGRLLQRPGGDQRHPLRAGAGVRQGRRARPACASPTCSSTASARTPTPTARSATCSTSSCARSSTSTRRASTCAWSSPSSTR